MYARHHIESVRPAQDGTHDSEDDEQLDEEEEDEGGRAGGHDGGYLDSSSTVNREVLSTFGSLLANLQQPHMQSQSPQYRTFTVRSDGTVNPVAVNNFVEPPTIAADATERGVGSTDPSSMQAEAQEIEMEFGSFLDMMVNSYDADGNTVELPVARSANDRRGGRVSSSSSSARRREPSRHENETRLKYLSKELCPLMDRFGRVLTDAAPYMYSLAGEDLAAVNSGARGASMTEQLVSI